MSSGGRPVPRHAHSNVAATPRANSGRAPRRAYAVSSSDSIVSGIGRCKRRVSGDRGISATRSGKIDGTGW